MENLPQSDAERRVRAFAAKHGLISDEAPPPFLNDKPQQFVAMDAAIPDPSHKDSQNTTSLVTSSPLAALLGGSMLFGFGILVWASSGRVYPWPILLGGLIGVYGAARLLFRGAKLAASASSHIVTEYQSRVEQKKEREEEEIALLRRQVAQQQEIIQLLRQSLNSSEPDGSGEAKR